MRTASENLVATMGYSDLGIPFLFDITGKDDSVMRNCIGKNDQHKHTF
jgi:hypothetical protein